MHDSGNGIDQYLNHMRQEEQQELLQSCLCSADDENDRLVDRILEVMEKHQQENSQAHRSDIERAWMDFQTYYNTKEGDGACLYDGWDT